MDMTSQVAKISQILPMSNGIFSHLTYDFKVITNEELDIMFSTSYGDRSVAPVVSRLVTGDVATDKELTQLASLIEKLYKCKWDRYVNLYNLEYDPIHNYKDELVESVEDTGNETNTGTSKGTTTNEQTGTNTDTRTDNLTEGYDSNNTVTNKTNQADDVFGFNSTTASNSDATTIDGNSTEVDKTTTTKTGTQINAVDSSSNSTISKDTTTSETNESTKSRTRTSTHIGNIGNLTTQQLITQDIELWKWNFIESVLTDFKDFLTLPIYL